MPQQAPQISAPGAAAGPVVETRPARVSPASALPDSPGWLLAEAAEPEESFPASALGSDAGRFVQSVTPQNTVPQPPLPPCPADAKAAQALSGAAARPPCIPDDPFRTVVNSNQVRPLTSSGKGYLAVRGVIDPGNFAVLTAQAGITVAANAHTAYGPGFKGFGRLTGYALLGDATGAFFGTYAIPSLVKEDPRYRRMQNAGVPRRVLHALARTVVAQHDDGRPMPNYATLLTYPIATELSNLYVPGVQGNGPSTAKRIALGYATDPISNLIAEFLPDVARHIHLKSVFFQQIINHVVTGDGGVL